MEFLTAILLIVCGVLAAASLIVSRSPNARHTLDKLVPFQGFLGVALLVIGILDLFRWFDVLRVAHKLSILFALTMWASVLSAIFLGFLLGMPQIARWMPGNNSAEQKGVAMQKKLAAYSTLVGVIGIVAGFLLLLYRLGILKAF